MIFCRRTKPLPGFESLAPNEEYWRPAIIEPGPPLPIQYRLFFSVLGSDRMIDKLLSGEAIPADDVLTSLGNRRFTIALPDDAPVSAIGMNCHATEWGLEALPFVIRNLERTGVDLSRVMVKSA